MGGPRPADELGKTLGVEIDAVVQDMSGHVVICNANQKVRRIVEDLQAHPRRSLDVVLLVQDTALWERNPSWHPEPSPHARFAVIHGCPTEAHCLRRAGIEAARTAIILADPNQGELADARSTLVAVAIERHNPQVHTVMELISSVNRVHLKTTDVNEVVCLGDVTEKLLAQSCITPGITCVFDRLLQTRPRRDRLQFALLPSALAGQTYRDLAQRAIASRAPFTLVGFAAKGRLVLNPRADQDPGKDSLLEAGDRLIAIGAERPSLDQLLVDASASPPGAEST